MQVPIGDIFGDRARTPARFVHHGSLAVDSEIDSEFRRTESYLRRDSKMRRIIDDLEHSPRMVKIIGDRIDRDDYTLETRTVQWDPMSAARVSGGGRQSPALGLGHELAHADMNAVLQRTSISENIPAFDNAEERRVILGAETHAARTLGEAIRRDHEAVPFRVSSSTDRY